jgi:hypothetical protein
VTGLKPRVEVAGAPMAARVEPVARGDVGVGARRRRPRRRLAQGLGRAAQAIRLEERLAPRAVAGLGELAQPVAERGPVREPRELDGAREERRDRRGADQNPRLAASRGSRRAPRRLLPATDVPALVADESRRSRR